MSEKKRMFVFWCGALFKATVSRILGMENDQQIQLNIKNNLLKQWRDISITQQKQKKVRMAKNEKDRNGLWYGHLVGMNSFQS